MFLLISLINVVNATNLNKNASWEMQKPSSVDICQNALFLKEDVVNALKYWGNYVDTSNIIINENTNCDKNKYKVVQIKIDPSIGLEAYGFSEISFYEKENNEFIHSVVITISTEYQEKYSATIKHELGHALGFAHSDHEIMKSHY